MYTKENLRQDILFVDEDSDEGKKNPRDYKYHLKVIQSIFDIETPAYSIEKVNLADIKDAIEAYIEDDECLYGYTFNLSLNPNFDYSWSYLRKQIDRYIESLVKTSIFIDFILDDINSMREELCEVEDLRIVFNDLFSVEFFKNEPFARSTILWENFYHISNVEEGYYISAMLEKTRLLTYYRRYHDKENNFLLNVKRILSVQ